MQREKTKNEQIPDDAALVGGRGNKHATCRDHIHGLADRVLAQPGEATVSVSKDTRAEVGSASSLVEEARPPSGFNISLQTAPDLLEGVLEGVETRGDGCAPSSRPRSYTLAAWGPSTLTHSAVKFGAIALYFCTSFCAGAIALYFCTSFCASL